MYQVRKANIENWKKKRCLSAFLYVSLKCSVSYFGSCYNSAVSFLLTSFKLVSLLCSKPTWYIYTHIQSLWHLQNPVLINLNKPLQLQNSCLFSVSNISNRDIQENWPYAFTYVRHLSPPKHSCYQNQHFNFSLLWQPKCLL